MKILKNGGWLFVVLALMFYAWHMGRYYERVVAEGEAETGVAVENEGQAEEEFFEFFTCRTTDDPDRLECHTVKVPGSEAPRVFDELLEELQEPSPKAEWDEDYREWKQAREGSDT